MMMKKLLYILLAITFALESCSEQIDVQETVPADCIMLKVFNSPMTKAVTDRSGEEYEKTLKRLDCFFYVKGQTDLPCVYYQKVDVDKVTTAEIPFYVDESVINTIFPGGNTTCDVFVIANLPSGTFATGMTGTDVATLNKIQLQLGQGYDAIDKNFLMAGLDVATKGDNNNATGTIPLYRAAAKITVSVSIPAEIIVEYDKADDVRMTPVLKDDTGAVTFKTAFHNGVTKTYLRDDYSDQIVADDFFYTDKKSYTYVSTTAATADAPEKYLYTCEIPFYSYAREWDKGADNPVYLTLDLPWKNETTGQHQTYYYQILVNAAGRELRPNAWYDLTVNVGVLGSKVEAEPVLLKNTTYYVLDWTTEPDPEHEAGGDRYEDVDIQKYTYLVVPETRLEINNATSGVLRFDASHKLGIQMNTASKPVEILKGTNTNYGAFYVNCGGTRPTVTSLPITTSNFTIDESKGTLTFNYTIPEEVYSPVYAYATIWLEIDGVAGMSVAEEEFSQNITIVQYPPMYITPDESNPYSIWVNNRQTNSSTDYSIGSHNLGRNPGHSGNNWDGNPSYMYTVTVTSFKETDTFRAHDGKEYTYIIGDPRQRVSDIELDDNGSADMATNWVTSSAVQTDANGNVVRDANGEIQYTTRSLEYYYPTGYADNAFRIVSPKFKIVSFFSSGWGNITSKGAAMRCATFQEDGYPAGRWRLPTEAEIMFVIDLQDEGVISDIFYGSSQYYSSTVVDDTHSWRITYTAGNPTWYNGDTNGSVRCVYDEWYWGAEREAKENPDWNGSHTTRGDNEYLFTWGDKKIW